MAILSPNHTRKSTYENLPGTKVVSCKEIIYFNSLFFLSYAGNCRGLVADGINVTFRSVIYPDTIFYNVGCRAGYTVANESSVRDVICQLNGTWTAFPDCESMIFVVGYAIFWPHLIGSTI